MKKLIRKENSKSGFMKVFGCFNPNAKWLFFLIYYIKNT